MGDKDKSELPRLRGDRGCSEGGELGKEGNELRLK